MNRIERDKQRSRMKKQIDDIMRNNPEYARRHKEEQEDNVMRAFRTFILISVDSVGLAINESTNIWILSTSA